MIGTVLLVAALVGLWRLSRNAGRWALSPPEWTEARMTREWIARRGR